MLATARPFCYVSYMLTYQFLEYFFVYLSLLYFVVENVVNCIMYINLLSSMLTCIIVSHIFAVLQIILLF